jgi:hypothetical protein
MTMAQAKRIPIEARSSRFPQRLSSSLLAAAGILALGLGSLAFFGRETPEAPSDPVVATINGEPVSAAEYRMVMERKTALVYNYFKQTRDLDDHFGYWSENSGPEGPLAKLRELTREELVRIKVSQGLAKERGLIQETAFADFQRAFERENARRSAAKKAGEVVYGPEQYRMPAYYYIRFGDLSYKLKQALAKEAEPSITENEIKQFYKENRETLAGKPLDEELRNRILSVLGKQKADQLLEACYAKAEVKMEDELLRPIVPRVDS